MPGTYAEQLRQMSDALGQRISEARSAELYEPLRAVEAAVERVERSWSGSNLGYQANVYYNSFGIPPAGHHFSSQWGFHRAKLGATVGDWLEMPPEAVMEEIRDLSQVDNIDAAINHILFPVRSEFEDGQATVVSVLTAFLAFRDDEYLRSLKERAAALAAPFDDELLAAWQAMPRQTATRDPLAAQQGLQVATHQVVRFKVQAQRGVMRSATELERLTRRAADHIERLTMSPISNVTERQRGSRVFIGHGRSPLWRELKDFVHERLGLPYDEFNRLPVAGVTNIDRLTEMLDNAAVAFLVLTAEDEREDGEVQARQNVVHESGLFQGRLGFSRSIILLEEGCSEFSNINGLGQIRFPKGNISAVFEEVRKVLEREGMA